MTSATSKTLPKAFIWRRLHSFTGFWLMIYLMIHLLTNSQAALFFGEDGAGFIRAVNSIQELPYLPVIEVIILVFPILIHMIWGIQYILTAQYNSYGPTGHTPYLPEYPRNRAYTWQRITSWLLVIGIIAHVVHMRFIERPESAFQENTPVYMMRVSQDEGLYPLSQRLGVKLYDQQQAQSLKEFETLQAHPLKPDEVAAVSNNFGTAELLMLRNTFKSPFMIVIYTLFVLAACFHAFNGLWTFMISWGVTLTTTSQRWMQGVSIFLMVTFAMLGLSAVWFTYWINLRN